MSDRKFKYLTEPTYTVRLYIAGDRSTAVTSLKRLTNPPNEGLCVTVEPTSFVYTGDREVDGMVIGFVNYPRFPKEQSDLFHEAWCIAEELMEDLRQNTALLVAPDKTTYIERVERI